MKLNPSKKKDIYGILHIIILLLSMFLVLSISIDIFKGIEDFTQSAYNKVQFWICVWFLISFVIEFVMADDKWKYFRSHFIFLLIAIPYQNIIPYLGLSLPSELAYSIRFMPLLRGGYALAIVVGWFTNNKVSSLFVTYLSMLMATVYFSSLAFYALEYKMNPAVTEYGDAVWWAFMNVTTVGSNIIAMTVTGKVLTVLLAAVGMMMFPIFTVYVTNMVSIKSALQGGANQSDTSSQTNSSDTNK